MADQKILEDLFQHAVDSVNPYGTVKSFLEKESQRWKDGVYVVGFGKAVSLMAKACEDVLGDFLSDGYLITKYDHVSDLKTLPLHEAGHPVPDENSLNHTRELVNVVSSISPDNEMLCLISGGGSSLFCKPFHGISLKDKQETTDLLLKAGADIFELNTVRKHISDVKGGRFLRFFQGRRVTSLILSDVIGDRLDVIASGPTTFDESTFSDALNVVKKYKLGKHMPGTVVQLLRKGMEGTVPETLKKDADILSRVENNIIGSLNVAIQAARTRAEELGLEVSVHDEYVTGEAIEAGKNRAREVKKIMEYNRKRPLCILSGGETTVTVRGKGKGGRNMEFALSFAQEISGAQNITLLSAGTDGNDGPTDAAGAIVSGTTVSKSLDIGMNPRNYLDNNDTYNFFKETGELFLTGPTGTNVMDIQMVLVS